MTISKLEAQSASFMPGLSGMIPGRAHFVYEADEARSESPEESSERGGSRSELREIRKTDSEA